jgi:hypothetical protein
MNTVRKVTPATNCGRVAGLSFEIASRGAPTPRQRPFMTTLSNAKDEARESAFRLSGCDAPSKPARNGQYGVRKRRAFASRSTHQITAQSHKS